MIIGRRRQHPNPCHRPPPPSPDIIQILEEEEDDEDSLVRIYRRGGDQNAPISVEDYADDVLLQHSIAASILASEGRVVVNIEDDDDVEIVEDWKGKMPVTQNRKQVRARGLFSESSIAEVGESSNSSRRPPPPPSPTTLRAHPPVLSTVLCAICMETNPLPECFGMKGCSHLFCSDCVRQYVTAKVQDNLTSIRCPDPGCKDGSLEPEMCRPFLTREVFERWGAALCESLIAGEMRFYCPFKDCSALLIYDVAGGGNRKGGHVIRHSECPHCHRLFCAQCRVPCHTGVTCEDFQRLGSEEREREDIMLMEMARKSKWQRCPKCKFYVERTEGCLFMRCRCGFRFCYGCASPMLIDHYCAKCRR